MLYEPDRSIMPSDAPPAPSNGEDLAAMRNAAERAVSEGLKALFDDYSVSEEELGDWGAPGVSEST